MQVLLVICKIFEYDECNLFLYLLDIYFIMINAIYVTIVFGFFVLYIFCKYFVGAINFMYTNLQQILYTCTYIRNAILV